MKRALCIWLPHWPRQRLALARPELRGQGLEDRGQGPGFAVCDSLADREALQAMAEWCGRFSPMVAVESVAAPESLLLDVTGLAHLFGGEAALAEQIVRDLARRGLSSRVVIADTIGAAWAMAHYGRGQGAGVRDQGLGNRGQGSGGRDQNSEFAVCNLQSAICNSAFTIVPPGRVLDALRSLPVAALRLSEDVVELLRQLGIHWIGQLEALPREELSSRFGPELLRRWDQSLGRLAEPLPVHRPRAQLAAHWSTEHPTARWETIEAVLESLIARVAGELVRLDRGAVRLECRLDCGADRSVPTCVGLFEPSASAGHLFELVRMQLQRQRLHGPVSAVRVEATATAPLEHRQQEMFFTGATSARQRSRQMASLVDRLSSRLGRASVVRVRLVREAQPELAWRYEPMVGDGRRRASGNTVPAELPPRPLLLFRRPVALAATSLMPDGPPLRFRLHGREHGIARMWGPERIETGWWRGRTVGRDYWRIETTTGYHFWLFRRLRDGRWFVHGVFE